MAPPLPTFFIVGAMKAGTTSLAAWLGAHPDVFVPKIKEVHFFDTPDRYARGLDWYREFFAGGEGKAAVGEATPCMAHPRAPARMAKALPALRCIAILRHPADRAYSQYVHHVTQAVETRTFGQVVEDDLTEERPGVAAFYIARGRYLGQLRHFRELFGRDAVQVLLFEDLSSDPHATYAKACRFIGVDDVIVPGNIGKVYNPRVRSPRVRDSVARLRARRLIPAVVAERVTDWNKGSAPASYPPMDPEVRRRLLDAYEPEIAGLEELLGRDLSAWRR